MRAARKRSRTTGAIVVASVVVAGLAAIPAVASPSSPLTWAPAGALGKPPASTRISTRLWQLTQPAARTASVSERSRLLSLPATGAGSLMQPTATTVQVEVRSSTTTSATSAVVQRVGGKVLHVSDRYATVTARVPIASLVELGQSTDVAAVTEVIRPRSAAMPAATSSLTTAAVMCGSATSEGDVQLRAKSVRSIYHFDGTGVKVGALSDSFDMSSSSIDARTDIASGDLPGSGNPCERLTSVDVVQELDTQGDDEGRGMLQIVHDLAPGAELAFATAYMSETGFADNIRALRAAGADILVDDVMYLDEPYFQQGLIDAAINDVTADGARYFTAAGNSNVIVGGKDVASWEAPAYRATACPSPVSSYEASCMDFQPAAGTDSNRTFTLANGGEAVIGLQWAEPWYGVTTDLDLVVVNLDTGGIAAVGGDDNIVTQRPSEFLDVKNTSGSVGHFAIVIGKTSGDSPRVKVDIGQSDGITAMEYPVSGGGDIVGPTIVGHAGNSSGMSVGAVPYDDATTPEKYSSRGPMVTYFEPVVGTTPAAATAPVVVNKPDFVATDGGATTFFGSRMGGVWRFYGTSAAAPHAAAVGALMLQAQPSLTAAQMRGVMVAKAASMAHGTSAAIGAGRLDALGAVALISKPPASIFSATIPGNRSARLTFTTGLVVTGNTATCTSSNAGRTGSGTGPSPIIVRGLSNGKTYTCKVVSRNGNGSTTSRMPGIVVPRTVPSAPTTPTVSQPGAGRALIKWGLPVTTGGNWVRQYQYCLVSCSRAVSWRSTALVSGRPARQVPLYRLVKGRTYTVSLRAVNAAGPSAVKVLRFKQSR